MRVIILAALCLSMLVLVAANDINAGERQEGDFHVASRRLFRPRVPGKSMIAQTGYNSAGEITAVTAVNAPGSDANVMIMKGGPGFRNVVVRVVGARGEGADVQVDIYATKPGKEDTEKPASP